MRFIVETNIRRRNQAHVDSFKTEEGAIQESTYFNDNVEALDEEGAKQIHAERVKAQDRGFIEVLWQTCKPYDDDGFKRADD